METNFNHEQSLALINEMISRARNNVQKERKHSMIFWGYTVALIALSNFALIHLLSNPHSSFLVWLCILPAWVVSYFIDRRIDRTAMVKTHIDKIGDMVWKGFGIAVLVLVAIVNIMAFKTNDFHSMMLINPIIMGAMGMCEFASASIYRYKPWYWVALFFWAGAIVCAFLRVDWQFMVLAACMILGFVVPGHLLNYQTKKSHV